MMVATPRRGRAGYRSARHGRGDVDIVARAANSRSSTHTNATPAFGSIQPSNRSPMLGVGADAGSRDSLGCWLLAM